MWDVFHSVFKFFTDHNVKFSNRFTVAMLIVFVIIFLNNIFGVTYYYNASKKVDSIRETTILLRDSSLSAAAKEKVQQIQKRVINRKNWIEQIVVYAKSLQLNRTSVNPTSDKIRRDPVIHYITANLFILLLMLALPFGFLNDKDFTTREALTSIIITEAIFIGFSVFWSWLLYFIPVIYGKPIINYSLHFLINGIVIAIIAYYNKRIQKEGSPYEKGASRL
jgi:hypothetical protein